MKLERFKEKNSKKNGIILFTITCIFLIAIVFFYNSFALFETKENFNLIEGNLESPGDLYFAYYVDDEITLDVPTKDSGYTLSSKSNCTNGVTVSWDPTNWQASLNFSEYNNEKHSRVKCNLYFEGFSYLRKVISDDTNGMWKENKNITKLIIQNKLNPIENAESESDESVEQDGSVMSYLVKNEDNTTYTAYLQSKGTLRLNINSSYLFCGFSALESIEGMEYLDTSNVTNMFFMFWGMSSLTTLDVSNFDTSNVTNMRGMFNGMSSLTSLDISNFNTSKVKNMAAMFGGNSSLSNLDISNFDTSNVTDMGSMFAGTSSLTSLDLSSFDTSNVTSMKWMFSGMSSLTSLDLSHFNTSKVTNMTQMFQNTSKLDNVIYGSKFIYANNIDVYQMYNNSIAPKPTHESWNGVTF